MAHVQKSFAINVALFSVFQTQQATEFVIFAITYQDREVNMGSLYEIDIELQRIMSEAEEQAIENDGEISDIIAERLEGLQQDRDVKIGNICRYIKSLNGEAEMVKAEANKLTDRAKVTENKAEFLKKYLSGFIPEGQKFSDENSKISWRKSKSIIISEHAEIPEEYQKVTVEPDKTALKKAVESGEKITGVALLEKQNIQIK